MTKPIIGLLGGSGFVGSALANRLVDNGYAVRIFTRARAHARHLWLLPDTDVVEVDHFDHDRLSEAVADCQAVINLIGILNERGDDGEGFRRIHVDIAARAAKACKSADVPRLLHMSALQADVSSPSHYLRTKGEAEKLLVAEGSRRLSVTIMRPSVIFGAGDQFLNRFARLLSLSPGIFALACADTRFQPVYVDDVVDCFIAALAEPAQADATFDLGGPQVMSLSEIVEYVALLIRRPTHIIRLGPTLSALLANVFEYFPGKPFSRDNYRAALIDSVCTAANGLEHFGIEPTPMHAVAPQFLGGKYMRNRYNLFRSLASRD